jgi:hypothetical protein
MHLISRDLYNAALLINRSKIVYEPGNAGHEALLASGIARLNPEGAGNQPFIALTAKGELVIQME